MNNNFDKVIILHGCPPTEQMITPKNNRWMNWLEKKLKEKGFDAIAPDLPTSWNPKYIEWKKIFEKYRITKNTMLVGHSCGAAFLVRWLLESNNKVKKIILVAPAKVPEGDSDAGIRGGNVPRRGCPRRGHLHRVDSEHVDVRRVRRRTPHRAALQGTAERDGVGR